MKLKIKGLTDAIIILNKIGIPLQGSTEAIINVVSEEQENEIKSLVNNGLLEIIEIIKKDDICSDLISKKSPKTDQEKVIIAEDRTQEMGSSVTIGTGQGTIKRKMVKNASDEIVDSERIKESLEAMKKLEEEESKKEPETDNNLEISEKMGNSAIVVTEAGEKSVNMTSSIVPGSEDVKNNNPFIDIDKKTDSPEKRKRGRPRKEKPDSKKTNIEETDDFDGDDNNDKKSNNDIFLDDIDDKDLGDAFIEC